MSDDCEGKAMHVSTFCSSLDFKETWQSVTACLGPLSIILLENESFSTQFQARLYGMSLKNRVVLLLGQCVVYPIHVTSFWKCKTSPQLNISTIILGLILCYINISYVLVLLWMKMTVMICENLTIVGCTPTAGFNFAAFFSLDILALNCSCEITIKRDPFFRYNPNLC